MDLGYFQNKQFIYFFSVLLNVRQFGILICPPVPVHLGSFVIASPVGSDQIVGLVFSAAATGIKTNAQRRYTIVEYSLIDCFIRQSGHANGRECGAHRHFSVMSTAETSRRAERGWIAVREDREVTTDLCRPQNSDKPHPTSRNQT